MIKRAEAVGEIDRGEMMGVDLGLIRRHEAAARLVVGQEFKLMASYDQHKTVVTTFKIAALYVNKLGDEQVLTDNGVAKSSTLRSLAIEHILDGGWRRCEEAAVETN